MALKEKIVQESLRLFSLNGFLSTSMTDILKGSGASKGGFYNHFKSKEDLFSAVISEARRLWRELNLAGFEEIENPVEKVVRLLENYRDRYLMDTEHLPGGCVFITLAVELADQRPHLAEELNEGFARLKRMIQRLLDEGKASGLLKGDVDTEAITELVFAGMLGSSVMYGVGKSRANLNRSIETLIGYIKGLSVRKGIAEAGLQNPESGERRQESGVGNRESGVWGVAWNRQGE